MFDAPHEFFETRSDLFKAELRELCRPQSIVTVCCPLCGNKSLQRKENVLVERFAASGTKTEERVDMLWVCLHSEGDVPDIRVCGYVELPAELKRGAACMKYGPWEIAFSAKQACAF
jgi:hypothetical protein